MAGFFVDQSTILIVVHFQDAAFDDAHVPPPYHLIPVVRHMNAFKKFLIQQGVKF